MCSASGNPDFARVGSCRTAALTFQLRTNYALGSYAADGSYESLAGSVVVDEILAVGFAKRVFSDRLQLGGQVPFHVQSRRLRGLPSRTAVGLGDMAISARYTFFDDPMSAPLGSISKYLDLSLLVTLPTGREVERGQADLLGADVTGEGVYASALGGRLSLVFDGTTTLNLAFAYEFRSSEAPANSVGDGVFGAFDIVRILNDRWSAGAGLLYRQVFDGPSLPNGNARIGRQRIRFMGTAVYGISVPLWELVLSVQLDPPVDAFGNNIPYGGVSGAVGLRRSFL